MATLSPAAARRTHPDRVTWLTDEARLRASYLATRRALAPFLVPHRFEGREEPAKLKRAGYGYGIQLNRSYLNEIFGHLRTAEATYEWGPLAQGQPDPEGAPAGGIARDLWTDATTDGVSLKELMEGDVLEWMLSSVGGFLVADAPQAAGVLTAADEQAAGVRPFFRFVPWSAVEDFGLGPHGFRWVKFEERVDNRTVDGTTAGIERHHVVYELTAGGATRITRFDKHGRSVDRAGADAAPVELGTILSKKRRPILPLVPVKFGTHPALDVLGTGLLYGLDDIIIDLFNVLSEAREAYRDAAFGLMVHRGPDAGTVRDALAEGSRFVTIGDTSDASLERVAGDSAEVATGITLIELGVRNWSLSAKRQAAEAMGPSGGAATQGSGVQVMAEFSLDLKPLLVRVVEALDAVETNALFIAAQLAGQTPEAADVISVRRSTEFQLEPEAERITRLVTEFVAALPLAPEAKVRIAMRWLEAADIIDLTEKVKAGEREAAEGEAGEPTAGQTVGDVIEEQTRELVEAEQAGRVQMATGPVAAFGGGPLPRPRIAGGPPKAGEEEDAPPTGKVA